MYVLAKQCIFEQTPVSLLLNEKFYTSHPTIFILIDILKKVEATTYVKPRSLHSQTPKKRVEKETLNFVMKQYGKTKKSLG